MKKMKKNITLLLVLAMTFSLSTSVFASTEEDENKSTTVVVVKNEKNSKSRHIKIEWEKVKNASSYLIELANNKDFDGSVTKTRYAKQGTYCNFAEVPNDIEDTYFIRVKPCFVYRTDNSDETVYGQWSDIVEAPYEDVIVDENTDIEIKFPWAPNKDATDVLKLFGKYKFTY